MLAYDSLLEQAKLRGMPVSKARGILREYLQILVIKELSRSQAGKKMFFTGGTCLRLVSGLKRFSEDLDFNSNTISPKEFESMLGFIGKEMERKGIHAQVSFSHWGNMLVATLIFAEIEAHYQIHSGYARKQGLAIKLETNRPAWKVRGEVQVIAGFGEMIPCQCTEKGAMFADKIDALRTKQRGRHIYDVIYMLANQYPLDARVLKKNGISGDPLQVILERIDSFSKAELRKMAESLRPFLFEESEAELVSQAGQIVPGLVEKYRNQA